MGVMSGDGTRRPSAECRGNPQAGSAVSEAAAVMLERPEEV